VLKRGRLAALLVVMGMLAIPILRPWLILNGHRHTKFGLDPGVIEGLWSKRSQLHSPDWGPRLLGDPQVTASRLEALAQNDAHGGDNEALVKYRGEWALTFAGLRSQGKSNEAILASPHGVEVTLATLAAEADPPQWWAGAGWLQKASRATPQGSFQLGLLGPKDVAALVERCEKLGEHQLPCLVNCVLRHQDGFSLEQRSRVLKAWEAQQSHYYNANNAKSVAKTLEVRQKVIDFLGAPGPLGVQMIAPPGFSPEEQKVCRMVAEDFLTSCGYQVRDGSDVKLEMGIESVLFEDVATDYFVSYTASERRQRQSGSVRIGKYSTVPIYTSEEVEVEHKDRRSQQGEASIPSLVWQLQKGETGARFSLPPYGDITQDQLKEMNENLHAEQLEESKRRDFDFYLRNYAGATWRYGLRPYELDWNVEDRLK